MLKPMGYKTSKLGPKRSKSKAVTVENMIYLGGTPNVGRRKSSIPGTFIKVLPPRA